MLGESPELLRDHGQKVGRIPRTDCPIVLSGKRILMTGGAGFIGTALARRLVAANEIVVLDNLHHDSPTGTALAAHNNRRCVEGDVLDLPLLRDLTSRATHVVHLA